MTTTTKIMDMVKKDIEREFDIVKDSGISIEFRDSGNYHFVISCMPKGKPMKCWTEAEMAQEALAYTE